MKLKTTLTAIILLLIAISYTFAANKSPAAKTETLKTIQKGGIEVSKDSQLAATQGAMGITSPITGLITYTTEQVQLEEYVLKVSSEEEVWGITYDEQENYIGANIIDSKDGKNKFLLMDKSGKTLWSKNFGYKTWGRLSHDGQKIFINSLHYYKGESMEADWINLHCVDVNGNIIWSRKYYAYPNISGNEKYIADFSDEDKPSAGITMYDIEGNKLWDKKFGFNSKWRAKLLDDGKMVVVEFNKEKDKFILSLLNNVDGNELWNYEFKQEFKYYPTIISNDGYFRITFPSGGYTTPFPFTYKRYIFHEERKLVSDKYDFSVPDDSFYRGKIVVSPDKKKHIKRFTTRKGKIINFEEQ